MENNVQDFQIQVLTRLAVIESKIDGYKEMENTCKEADARSKQNEKDIQELKERNKWLRNTVIGAIITSVISLLFLFTKIGLGV